LEKSAFIFRKELIILKADFKMGIFKSLGIKSFWLVLNKRELKNKKFLLYFQLLSGSDIFLCQFESYTMLNSLKI
jgi:hypothetical protein